MSEGVALSDVEAEMSPEQRLDFLRARGVEVETHEERVAAEEQRQGVARGDYPTAGTSEASFVYVKLPADDTLPVQALRAELPASRGDALRHVLAPAFADETVLDERAVERETKHRLQNMLTGAALAAPKAATIAKLAVLGAVEAYPLAQPTAANKHHAVRLYIDEVGALRQRPRNARAERLAAAAGLSGLSLHGDVYVGRTESLPGNPERNLDFAPEELAPDAAWAQHARAHHSREYDAIPEKSKGLKSGKEEDYEWMQTMDDVEVKLHVEPSAVPLKKRLKVSYGRGDSLRVLVDGLPLLSLSPLFAPIAPDDCSWSVDGPTLVVTLEKRDSREWASLTLLS